jgi:hypothetical protein
MIFNFKNVISVSSIALFLVLSGCNGSTNNSVSSWANDLTILASGLSGTIAPLAEINGLNSETVKKIQDAVVAVQNAADEIQKSTTPTSTQVDALRIAVNAVLSSASSLCTNGSPTNPLIPANVCMGIESAAILAPVVETAIQIAINHINPPANTTNSTSQPTSAMMKPVSSALVDEARLFLRAHAK